MNNAVFLHGEKLHIVDKPHELRLEFGVEIVRVVLHHERAFCAVNDLAQGGNRID